MKTISIHLFRVLNRLNCEKANKSLHKNDVDEKSHCYKFAKVEKVKK